MKIYCKRKPNYNYRYYQSLKLLQRMKMSVIYINFLSLALISSHTFNNILFQLFSIE
jgi:hypothetical protein